MYMNMYFNNQIDTFVRICIRIRIRMYVDVDPTIHGEDIIHLHPPVAIMLRGDASTIITITNLRPKSKQGKTSHVMFLHSSVVKLVCLYLSTSIYLYAGFKYTRTANAGRL